MKPTNVEQGIANDEPKEVAVGEYRFINRDLTRLKGNVGWGFSVEIARFRNPHCPPGLKARLSQRFFGEFSYAALRELHPPSEVVQLLKIGYATIYEDASPSRREGREVRAGKGSM
jgi:hypothetical protein